MTSLQIILYPFTRDTHRLDDSPVRNVTMAHCSLRYRRLIYGTGKMAGIRQEPSPNIPAFEEGYKKADLHCHSRYSVFKYFRKANTRDSYNHPEDVCRVAKERGMDYVTLSDHDSIDGAIYLLNEYPNLTDFFISEIYNCIFGTYD